VTDNFIGDSSSSNSTSFTNPTNSLGPDGFGSDDSAEVSTVVSARGTEDGLILRIDGKSDWNLIVSELDAFLGGKKRFFEGGEVSVEWLERLPTKEQSSELEAYLKNNFGISITQRKRKLARLLKAATTYSNTMAEMNSSQTNKGTSPSLFDDIDRAATAISTGNPAAETLLERVERLAAGEDGFKDNYENFNKDVISEDGPIEFAMGADANSRNVYTERVSNFFGSELLMDEEANARVVYGTLRSGQRVETPFTLIVVGDVNPGADLIAGGDVIVIGSLRGTAHAAAYEDDMVDRAIIALQMQPMQLRIGSVVSRGGSEAGKVPEMARIDNRSICVEPYSSRILASRKQK